jgi:hypothetical protein
MLVNPFILLSHSIISLTQLVLLVSSCIAFIVFYLSLVKRILHYLKGPVGREIIMTNNGGFYVFVGGNLIS